MITANRNKKPMSRAVQQEFIWPDEAAKKEPTPETTGGGEAVATKPNDSASLSDLKQPVTNSPPLAAPLREAVEHGVFGATTDGPIDPDEEEVRAMTEEHGRELIALLADIQAVEDAARTGEDPRTGKTPRTPEAEAKLRQFLEHEEPRLKSVYAAALDTFARYLDEKNRRRLHHRTN
jgi:hypothetical protein